MKQATHFSILNFQLKNETFKIYWKEIKIEKYIEKTNFHFSDHWMIPKDQIR